MDIGMLHLIRPWWLLALPMCVALPWLWSYWRRPSGDWSRVCDPHLLQWLSVGDSAGDKRGFGSWFTGLVMTLCVLALSGPSWQQLPDASFSAQDARVLVLDLSSSMLAEDLKPNRLTRARFQLSDLLDEFKEGQVGMVAYAGDAYVVSPLTNDTNTIANMLPALRPDVIPVAGSRADRALDLAAELLERSGAGGGEILLITDDVTDADIALAGRLADQGVVVSVLAVGTADGAPIPSGNGFLTDPAGNVVIARLNLGRLQAMARAGNGKITVLGTGPAADAPWQVGDGTQFAASDESLGERWKDAGPWLLLLLLPFVASGFRRGLLFVLPAMILPTLLLSAPAQAGVWEDLWKNPDQQAQAALKSGNPGQAAELAADPDIAAEALYRAGDYTGAAGQWQASAQQMAQLYNQGNAMALAGDLDAAIKAYDQALALNPNFEDALYNKALIEQMKQQQEQQQESEDESGEGEEQQGDPQDSEEQNQQDAQNSEQEGEGEPQESEQSDGEQQQQQQEEQMAQAWTEEDAQAMEQWLRRIPDDPGGLLRRKFRNEHQRRGAPGDEKKQW